jgi:hypothetical protein
VSNDRKVGIENILTKISKALVNTEDGKIAYGKYKDMMNHDGWKVHQGLLVQIANMLVEEMLSREYTELPIREKDAAQRALFQTKKIVEFLMNPIGDSAKWVKIMQHNKRMEETSRPTGRKGK